MAIAEAVRRVLANPLERTRRVQSALADIAAFSWEAVAAKMLTHGFLA